VGASITGTSVGSDATWGGEVGAAFGEVVGDSVVGSCPTGAV
jgi:hypothetical protein